MDTARSVSAAVAHGLLRAMQTVRPLVGFVPSSIRDRLGHRLIALAQKRGKVQRLGGPLDAEAVAGLNVFGPLDSPSGIGQAARGLVRAARAAGVPVHEVCFSEDHLMCRRPLPDELRKRPPYAVNCCCVNADSAGLFVDAFGVEPFRGRINAAYWVWELEHFPPEWGANAAYFDEIWVPSAFVEHAVQASVDVPVVRIPYCVEAAPPQGDCRPQFGIPRHRQAVLVMFDAGSRAERKNPWAAIRTFRQVARSCASAFLVLKVSRPDFESGLARRLLRELEGLDHVLLDQLLDRADTLRLIAACDVLLSLHRSEGFGLVLAEAMALGKPVVATGYSGNVDFMNRDNSYPVGYQRAKLDRAIGPYPAGSTWADPDERQAAEILARLVSDPSEGRDVGRRASQDIRRQLSEAAVGELVRSRLEEMGCLV